MVADAAAAASVADPAPGPAAGADGTPRRPKLHGRAFYESIGSPKYILAPMVDQSEFAWRLLTRSFLPPDRQTDLVAYTPMLHARLFAETAKYRQTSFKPTRAWANPPSSKRAVVVPAPESSPSSSPSLSAPPPPTASTDTDPYLDGNPALDRPLFVQFCANDPAALLEAAQHVAPYCDAVDLNLGCPQGIARKGHYGAFLQEDQDLIFRLINTLHRNLTVPVTAKIRVLDTPEATLAYARNVLAAGASILTVHGRRREQKGHCTGLADWKAIRHLRHNLPPETVLFANGNVLRHADLEACLRETGADGVMSAEGNLSDPGIFAAPPEEETREYWRGKDGRGGWRVDAVMRRYLDILHRYVLGRTPPERRPLFVPGDEVAWMAEAEREEEARREAEKTAPKGKRKRDPESGAANFSAMQPHMFHLLRHLVGRHTDVRDALARAPAGDMDAYERILGMVELRVARGLLEYVAEGDAATADEAAAAKDDEEEEHVVGDRHEPTTQDPESSVAAVQTCRRPWWVAQPIIRPMPKEAMEKGALQASKKDKAKAAAAAAVAAAAGAGLEKMPRGNKGSGLDASPAQKSDLTTQASVDQLVAG